MNATTKTRKKKKNEALTRSETISTGVFGAAVLEARALGLGAAEEAGGDLLGALLGGLDLVDGEGIEGRRRRGGGGGRFRRRGGDRSGEAGGAAGGGRRSGGLVFVLPLAVGGSSGDLWIFRH